MNSCSFSFRSRCRGAVLLVAMVFLLLMALVAGTVMQTSVLEFRMAGNDQFREEAFQKAQAIAQFISENSDNFPVVGDVGYTICATTDASADCDTSIIVPDSTVEAVPSGVVISYQVERQGPLILETLPFRQDESSVSSSPAFDAAIFETAVEVDGTSVRLGKAEVVQGVALMIASSSQ